jgi:hypothetical protein
LALLQAVAFTLFPLLAQLGLIIAQLFLRLLTMTGPIIGLVAIVYPGILRKVANTAGTVVVSVFVLATLSAVHIKFLDINTADDAGIPLFTQITLAWLITGIFLTPGILLLVQRRRDRKHQRHNKTRPEPSETQTDNDQNPPRSEGEDPPTSAAAKA